MPTFARFFHWLFTWRILRRVLIGFAALITLVALGYAVTNRRGQRAWETYQRELAHKTPALEFTAYIPAPVPNEQNFAMTPFLAPLFDFNPNYDPNVYQPGQSRWRDTNALDRVQSFARVMVARESLARDSAPGWAEGVPTDLVEWLSTLQGTNAQRSAPPTREAAARGVLEAVRQFDPVLDELRQASRRPYTRFNIHYEEDSPWSILLPHLAPIKQISLLLQVRASAELAAGESARAFDDAQLILHLVDAPKSEPFLISQMVRYVALKSAVQVIWEGLEARQWSDQQLQAFQDQLARFTFLTELKRSLDAERAASNYTFDQFRAHPSQAPMYLGLGGSATEMAAWLAPRGWFYQEQLSYNRVYDQFLLPDFDAEAVRFHPSAIDRHLAEADNLLRDPVAAFRQHRLISRVLVPALGRVYQRAAFAQTAADEARLACALERHRLATGRFPETLAALQPQYVRDLPHDVCSGDPLKYRRSDADGAHFLLYSVGWNEKDDGGVVASKSNAGEAGEIHPGLSPQPATNSSSAKPQDLSQGDWVWRN